MQSKTGELTTGDYKPVSTVRNPFPGHSAYIGAAYRPLYNGNISSMGVNIGQLNQPQLYNYEYDQLNRLVSMQAYRNFDQPGNSWSGISATMDHQEAVTYDGNGNITAYLRNGNTSAGKPLAMDALSYHYNKDGNGNLLNNKLRYVSDGVTATANYTEDIDGQVTDNYHYDQIGNLTGDVSEQIDSIEWNVYGKISRIWKSVNATTGALQQIAYSYDPSGNRISKTVYSNQDASNYKAVHTWYVRDASGNVMATYSSEDVAAKSTLTTGTLGKLYLSELHMYGSSRLGIWSRKVDMDVVPGSGGTAPLLGTTGIDTFNRGNKFFELSNHLGNVLVTVSDRKLGQNPVNGLYSSYTAEVVSASDYAPFGMQMVGRTFSAGSYRYGFNGKENDNEVKGEGNQQDYGMRIYDPRLGKFLSVDPITSKYSHLTPYQFASNRPIDGIDLDGLEFFKKDETSYRIDYKPVLNSPDILTGSGNIAHNTIAFVWNGTLGAIMESGKSINNYFAGGYKKGITSPDPVHSFIQATNGAVRYHMETPINTQLREFGKTATDLTNYEILPSLIIAHSFSSPTAITASSARLPLQEEIFTNSISSRVAAEKYAELTSYKSYFNANDFIKANNQAFDLISTIENRVVDVATTSKTNLKISTWEKTKLERLNSLRPSGYNATLHMYVKEGQYTAEQLAIYKKSLNDYITNEGLKNVIAEVSEIPKR